MCDGFQVGKILKKIWAWAFCAYRIGTDRIGDFVYRMCVDR